ncbi:universal stress protein YxiE [Aplysia californica]|uniref:Universal stress protein YxiE n=1 Tax=Aplysia californica TaxID=6500 RepID=A0ABM0ZUC0_APLCA|nr:universal stress protein YxiE [Aplysia californica]
MATAPRKILIAMDGSKHSQYAFDYDHCSSPAPPGFMQYFYKDRDEVLIVYSAEHGRLVCTPIPSTDPTLVAKLAHEEEEDIKQLIADLQQLITNAGIKGRVLRVSGAKPGELIVKASEENKVDMIITGTRGLGSVRRTLMGSVSGYIVHHSKIPVLVVRGE